ncbi:hypothetical protein PRIPAC_73650 [Pristionchus pacificus]|uniref:Uncharacterized protein n=1 Tax=Pristionchus pacificus TaxID=54126 RepID=H3FYA1_PRIPA|nr:hypothetical protein PRIPAC_72613 [Pristionchus pacificus]KAF8384508.1 hypothetical protein PRIPAC_73650 [Pristionchus pacificus]|eukprot:PDM83607.1 hypothetical protein PRIPAC_30094 [Pristionchus pacificus]
MILPDSWHLDTLLVDEKPRRLPNERPEVVTEEACEEACVTVEVVVDLAAVDTASRLSTFLSLLDFTHCL